jgi:SAM-dependent methyltransferase
VNPTPETDATAAWDQYWHDGRLASCGGEGGANYQPVITAGWRRFFDSLANGAHVLDVCTGNGAVARLAAEVAVERNLRVAIDAVDSALLNPIALEPGADMIRFSSRVAAESLPFPDANFDVIVGQYAIEYTDLARSMPELRRVSRPAARVRFVTHAAGSVVVQAAGRQLDDAQRLLGTGIFEAANALARASANPASLAESNAARTHFQQSLQALHDASTRSEDLQMYQNVGNVLVHALSVQAQAGTDAVLAKIAEVASAIRAHEARLSAMRRAALDDKRAQAFGDMAGRL